RAGRLPPGTLAPAAVLVALLDRGAGPAVLFTRRHDGLVQHAGQVAFPGGGTESTDRSPEETALREASEEVGLPPECVRVLGRLPRYPTTSAYLVTPVVGYVKDFSRFVMQRQEVADIFSVPFEVLLDRFRWQEQPVGFGGERFRFPELIWEDRRIWGATAGMLRLLLPALRDAWRQAT
ncbi:MAG: NUDIX hydrolase, partial [Gammaproteobacteria bacterium]